MCVVTAEVTHRQVDQMLYESMAAVKLPNFPSPAELVSLSKDVKLFLAFIWQANNSIWVYPVSKVTEVTRS